MNEKLKLEDTVIVYDRYRFAIPLRATVKELSKNNDGVRVQLLESNSVQCPVGCDDIWVHERQLKLIEAETETRPVKDPIQILKEIDVHLSSNPMSGVVASGSYIHDDIVATLAALKDKKEQKVRILEGFWKGSEGYLTGVKSAGEKEHQVRLPFVVVVGTLKDVMIWIKPENYEEIE